MEEKPRFWPMKVDNKFDTIYVCMCVDTFELSIAALLSVSAHHSVATYM